MVEVAGVEPSIRNSQGVKNQYTCENEHPKWTHIGSQSFGPNCPRLAKLVKAWKKLPEPLKAAIEAIVQSNA
jgi:hypothetical protein